MERRLFDNQVYNALTVNATVREIVEIIRSQISDIRVEYVDTRIMNQLSYRVLDEKLRALGFEVAGSLEEGIRQTIRLLRNARPHGV
jgi:nucleoside-diphosphate-sugar epimerase